MEEDKIKEIIGDFRDNYTFLGRNQGDELQLLLKGGDAHETLSWLRKALKEHASYIREKTIEECIGWIIRKRQCRSHEPENCNICEGRKEALQTLKELSNLKK